MLNTVRATLAFTRAQCTALLNHFTPSMMANRTAASPMTAHSMCYTVHLPSSIVAPRKKAISDRHGMKIWSQPTQPACLPQHGQCQIQHGRSFVCYAISNQQESSSPDPSISEVMAVLAGQQAEDPVSLEDATCVKVLLPAVPGLSAELLSDALLGVGATSVVLVEHRAAGMPEQEIFEEPGSGSSGLWDTCDLVVYFPLEHDVRGSVQEAAEICEMGFDTLELLIEPVANTQWVDQIKASYKPLQISPSLYIVPEWSQPTDPSALNIILQPGVAFGTGEHPTTRLCLHALEQMKSGLQGAHMIDYGTGGQLPMYGHDITRSYAARMLLLAGSGVLALAALLLGAESAVGTDTDPLAVRSAKRNAELTGVGNRFDAFVCAPHLNDPEPLQQVGYPRLQFDIVAANILQGPLLDLQPRLSQYCKPGGTLLLSGILAEQVPDIQAAYESCFEDIHVTTEGSWACITARRRAS